MWKTECPKCGGFLYITSFKACTRIPLYPEGFSTLDAVFMDTEDEVVRCDACGEQYKLYDLEEEDEK